MPKAFYKLPYLISIIILIGIIILLNNSIPILQLIKLSKFSLPIFLQVRVTFSSSHVQYIYWKLDFMNFELSAGFCCIPLNSIKLEIFLHSSLAIEIPSNLILSFVGMTPVGQHSCMTRHPQPGINHMYLYTSSSDFSRKQSIGFREWVLGCLVH